MGDYFLKKLLIGLVAAGVLLIAAVLIAPSFIDWNAHKKQISSLVREATGRELSIRGDIDVTILPSPALRVEDVRLASVAGAVSPEMIRLPEARISFAFGSLLEGRLAAVVTLMRPTVNLEKLQDGRVNWNFAPAGQPAADASATAAGETSSGIPFDVKLDSFRIVSGTVSYHDAVSGTVERIEKLSSEISFDSLRGPFRIDGTATVRGIPVALKVSTGIVKPDAPLSTIVELSVPDGDTMLRLNGTISGLDGEPTVQGDVEMKSGSVAALMATAFGAEAPGVLAQPLTVQGSLSGSKESVAFGAIDIEFGSARATGDVKADLANPPRITGSIRTGNLNLDAFLDGGKQGPMPARPAAAVTASGGSAAPGPAGPQMKTPGGEGFTLPNAEVSVIVGAEIIQYNGALVRDLSVKAALKGGKGVIEEISAILPGSTSLAVKGTVAAVDGKPDMNLALSGRSDNLREMLDWVGVDTASVPADRLRRFSMSAAITGSPQNLTARDISVQLDASKLSGGLALVLRDRPAFGLRLVVDRVNVDGYLAGRDAPIGSAPAQETAGSADAAPDQKPAGIHRLADALRFLEKFDANIDATVKSLIVARTPASDLRLDFTVLNGGLQVRQAGIGDLAGLRGSLKGTLDRSKEQPAVAADYSVEIVDAARFARFIDKPALLAHKAPGRLASSGKVDGNFNELAVNSRLEALGITVDVNGVLTSLLQTPAFKLATSIRAPELVQLVRLGVEDYTPAAGKLGPVDLSFQLEGSANQVKAESVTGHAGPVTLHGSAGLVFGEPRPKLRAAFTTSEVSLDLFLPPEGRRASQAPVEYRIIPAAVTPPTGKAGSRWSTEPIDTAMLEALDADVSLDVAVLAKDPYRFKDSKLRVRLEQGKLSLDQMDATFSTGAVTATGTLVPDQGKLAGTVKFAMNGVDASDLVEALRNYQVRLGPVRFGAKMRGPVTLTGEFNSRGVSEREFVTGLTGTARLSGQLRTEMSSETRQAGAVAGLAGALLGKKVKEIRGITDVVQGTDLLVSAFEGPSTLNGDITAEGGVLTTRNLVLVGRGGRALTTATASLPAWTLDSLTDITLGQDSDPYLTAQAAGALDDPYLRKVGGTLLRGRPVSTTPSAGQTQQGTSGEPTPRIVSPQEAEQPAPVPKKVKPEDVLKGLLQGLSR